MLAGHMERETRRRRTLRMAAGGSPIDCRRRMNNGRDGRRRPNIACKVTATNTAGRAELEQQQRPRLREKAEKRKRARSAGRHPEPEVGETLRARPAHGAARRRSHTNGCEKNRQKSEAISVATASTYMVVDRRPAPQTVMPGHSDRCRRGSTEAPSSNSVRVLGSKPVKHGDSRDQTPEPWNSEETKMLRRRMERRTGAAQNRSRLGARTGTGARKRRGRDEATRFE